jgi:signal transduction histidine kinase
VSERPKAGKRSFLSRLRRPVGRLRDMPIWSKLGLIMIVPTIATIVVGTTGLVGHLQSLNTANRAHALANLTRASGDLVNNLQDERALAVLLLGVDPNDPKKAAQKPALLASKQRYRAAYARIHDVVDQSKAPYSQQRNELTDLPQSFTDLLQRIDQGLTDLPGTRSQVDNGKFLLTAASQTYEGLIANILDMRDSAAQLAGDASLSERMRASTTTSRAKEFMSQRRVVVHRAIINNRLSPVLRTDYIATDQGEKQALQSFEAIATRDESEFYDRTVSGPDQRVAGFYSGWVSSRGNEEGMNLAPFTADEWDTAMVGNAKLIRTVEAQLDANVVNQATVLRDDVQQAVFLETGLLLSMLLLAILFAYLVARSMARSLRELRHGALAIAQYGLPHAVSRLRDPQLSAQMSPVQLANQIAEPLPVRSKDEFGQVTEAFNAVHLEAVRTAAEQAALRASVATMFVNLARRSQILVDRLIGHLDRLERGEEDPDRLAELFQLDHLATRMRRNDENLLVLAGADSTRVQREPAALIDVLRAAQSEVEHYTRIEFGVIDRDLEVAAHAVNDLVHLVAELFDNATAFSPPDSQVMVEARRVGDRASLYVEDRGIGITADQLHELNERLATPPQVDVAVSRMMGLVVVARLASRHGVRVELRPGSDRGTVADVTLPTAVLVPRALSGRVQQPAAVAGATPQAAAPAGNFGSPLALGSGPAIPSQRSRGRDAAPAAPAGGGFGFPPANGGPAGNPAGPGRAMPAWSDLTGASTGPNGSDSFPPRSTNGNGIEPLPQRRGADQWTVEGEVTENPSGPHIPGQNPSSPEVRSNGFGVNRPAAPPVSSAPPAPPAALAQPPALPMRTAQPAPPAAPVSSAPAPAAPPAAPPQVQRPAGAPPAWPPVAGEREAAGPPVPERAPSGIDMTTELPRIPRDSERPVPTAQPTAAESRQRFADETMELPIFRELESAWFRTGRSAPEKAATAPAAAATAPAAPAPAPAAPEPATRASAASAAPTSAERFVTARPAGQGTPANAAMADSPMPGDSARDTGRTAPVGSAAAGFGAGAAARRGDPPAGGWQTAADAGWRAAGAATEVSVNDTTSTGLPKRTPMAQLVPGGVEKPTTSVQRRTPESVRGLLSAYHRGVQRGRTHPGDDSAKPEGTSAGQQSSQAGLGPAARSGQKEHEG